MKKFAEIVYKALSKASFIEMAYPANFNLKIFSNIPTFKDRIAYCKERLKLLGNGSARIVFQIDNKKVLKIAKNAKGIAQNEKEEDWGRNCYGCFAEIYSADEKTHRWIEMELARKATKKDFLKSMGIDFDDLMILLMKMYNAYTHPADNDNHHELAKLIEKYNNEKINNLYRYMEDYQPNFTRLVEWRQMKNWGIVNRNGEEYPVIIDDGFDEDIWNQYYKKN